MESHLLIIGLIGFLSLQINTCASQSMIPNILEPVNIYHKEITLSGFSSGATFAQMLQISYSSLFSGIAVFSHTYYRCGNATGKVNDYDAACTKLFNLTEEQLYDPNKVHDDIREYTRKGLIEDTRNLQNKRLYVYAGLRNVLFTPRQTLSVVSVYEPYIKTLETIFTRVQDANLVLPTDSRSYGGPCTNVTESQFFIGQCGFSGVTEAMNFLLFSDLGTSADAFKGPGGPRRKVSMFDQREFTKNLRNHQMDDVGYYYIPRRCRNNYYGEKCYLHIYFHGCLSGREFANSTHVENTGLLELADRRGIIMIFPQARSSLPENEIGCWDTFGISGKLYATKEGVQVKAVKAMIDRLMGKTKAPSSSSVRPVSSLSYPNYNSNGRPVKGNGNYNGYNNRNNQHRYSSHFKTNSRYG